LISQDGVIIPLDQKEDLLEHAPGIRSELRFHQAGDGGGVGDQEKGEWKASQQGRIFVYKRHMEMEAAVLGIEVREE
jgi:hypothetical protein